MNPEGEMIGYLCATDSGAEVVAHRARSDEEHYRMICEWLLFSGVTELVVHTAAYEVELNRRSGKICEKLLTSEVDHIFPFCFLFWFAYLW